VLGELFDFAFEFRCWDCGGLETRRCAAVGPVRHKIELIIDHRSMTGEHHHPQVLARAACHVDFHCVERIENSSLVRRLVVQEYRLHLSIEPTLLRV